MELPRVDQPQAPDTVEKLLQGGKLPTAKKIQFLQAPVASLCQLFSVFRQVRYVRVLAPRQSAGLFSPLQFMRAISKSQDSVHKPQPFWRENRLTSWQFRGRKAIMNHASALVSVFPSRPNRVTGEATRQ